MSTPPAPPPAVPTPPALYDRDVQQAELRFAIDAVVRDSLSPVAAGLGLLYLIFTFSHLLVLPKNISTTMAVAALLSSLSFGSLYLLLRRHHLPLRFAQPLGFGMACVVIANSLLHLLLTQEPQQTTNLVLLVVGVGFLFLSPAWLTLTIVVALGGWGMLVSQLPASESWLHFGFALLSGSLLSAIVHAARLRTTEKLERMRIQDAYRKKELETVLRHTEEAQRSLATSMAIGQSITSILDLDVLLSQVADLIQQRFNCYFVAIMLLDESGTDLVFRAGSGEAGRRLVRQGLRVRLGDQGLVSWVAVNRKPACVEDVTQDSRYLRVEDVPLTRAELALPLLMGDALLGVLDMESTDVGAFRTDDVPFLQLLADQVATAIQNASLYAVEKSRRALIETLYNVGRAISSTLDLVEVLDKILQQVGELIPYDRASVMLDVDGELEIAAARGFPPNYQNIRVSIRENDVFQQIYRSQQPLAIDDVMDRPDWQNVSSLPQARSWLGVPLIHMDEVIGMLSLTRKTRDAYTPDEVALASTLGGQAAIAIHNARLYQQITRFNQDLESLVQERTEALQTAYDNLEHLDHTKTDFISIASHELRTPITVVHGYVQMLQTDPLIQENANRLKLVNGIETGAQRLNEIVESLLDVAKIDNRELVLYPAPVSIESILQLAASGLAKSAQDRHITFVLQPMPDLPAIEADPDALRKVFTHLMVNAIKYTPDGGSVTISGWALEPGQADLPEGGIEVLVCDTGVGIAPDFNDLIFEKFFQTGQVALHSSGKTKFKGGGPGLGLAIARGIVHAHGGRLWAESPGHDEKKCPGSKFHVVLPLRQNNEIDVT